MSTAPACIRLVGTDGTNPSALGTFTVIVRDLASNLIPGASVVVDLSRADDIAICADQLDGDALVNCDAKTVRKFTDATGTVTFTLLGGSNGGGNATTLLNGGLIYGNGVLLKSPTVAAYDLDGGSGVGANDLSAWFTDFGTGAPYGRSDYDCSGTLGGNDLSFWLTAFGASTQIASCAATCP